MERILGLSLVGAGPGNVFGPGMSAGVLESYARRGGLAETETKAAGRAGGSSASGSGSMKKSAAEIAEAGAKGSGGQEVRGAGANARLHHPALDGTMFWFEAAPPH